MMKNKRIQIIYNPESGGLYGSADTIQRLVAALRTNGLNIEDSQVKATTTSGDATRMAHEAVAQKIDVLIACGGDGTINETAQALVGTSTALAILPSGTANVLAKEMRLPRQPEELAKLIAAGRTREISVGLATKPGENWQRYFLLMAGIGLDAAIIATVNPALKKKFGLGAYVTAGLKTLVEWRLKPFSLNFNQQKREATFAIIANATNYAAWFRIAPQANMESDHLDVCIFNSRSRLVYLSYAFLSLFGTHTISPQVIYEPITETYVSSAQETPVQLDGELVGYLPMKFACVPHAMRIVA